MKPRSAGHLHVRGLMSEDSPRLVDVIRCCIALVFAAPLSFLVISSAPVLIYYEPLVVACLSLLAVYCVVSLIWLIVGGLNGRHMKIPRVIAAGLAIGVAASFYVIASFPGLYFTSIFILALCSLAIVMPSKPPSNPSFQGTLRDEAAPRP